MNDAHRPVGPRTNDIQWLKTTLIQAPPEYEGKPKFKYLLPLDDEIAERIKSLSKPYPHTRATSETSDTLESIQERDEQHAHGARLEPHP